MRNSVLAKDARDDNRAQLAFAVQACAIGLFEWDIASDRLTWAQGDEARLGLRPGSVVDFQSWQQRVFPEDVSITRAAIAEAVERGLDQFTVQYRLRGDDGRVRTIEAVARCIYDSRGTLVRTTGVNIDVTERVEREATLRDREAELQSIVETMPDAMIVFDADGLIRRFTAPAERLFGYRAEAVLGQHYGLLASDCAREQLDQHLAEYEAARDRGISGAQFEIAARHQGGTQIPVEVSIGAATIGGERLFTAFVRDLTERAAAEHAAADLRKDLAQVGRVAAMGEMAASLAHELNQPLSATANFLSATALLVARGAAHDKVAEMVALANEQIQRAGSIIRNVREFIVKRDADMRIAPIEKTVRDAVSLVLVGAVRLDVEVRYAFEQAGAFMLADRVQIQQVLVNLIRNATEALHGQPRHRQTISITVRDVADDMIEISVNDTGSGIDAGILEKIFTPLSSTKGQDGMGLGLSICRRIVEAHGGTLTAENRPTGGASFRFTLPGGSLSVPDEQ